MKIKLVKRKNPQNKAEEKHYASPVNAGRKTMRDIAQDVAGRSSLTRGDIENVIFNFLDRLPAYLTDGFSVQLGELGTLRLSLSSKGSADEKTFDVETIKPHVVLTPGVEVKDKLRKISYERVKEKKEEKKPNP